MSPCGEFGDLPPLMALKSLEDEKQDKHKREVFEEAKP